MSDDLFSTPEHQIFRETVRKFVEEELAPRAREFDEMGRFDKALYPRLGDLGVLGLRYDPKWGGAGLDYSYTAIFYEELGRCGNAGVSMGISVQTDMATPSLHQFGSDALRQQFLVPAIKGELVTAIAVTEPDAGSDVAGIKTRAVRDGDNWVINGSKTYITNAATADWLCLLAVTDPKTGKILAGSVSILEGGQAMREPRTLNDEELSQLNSIIGARVQSGIEDLSQKFGRDFDLLSVAISLTGVNSSGVGNRSELQVSVQLSDGFGFSFGNKRSIFFPGVPCHSAVRLPPAPHSKSSSRRTRIRAIVRCPDP